MNSFLSVVNKLNEVFFNWSLILFSGTFVTWSYYQGIATQAGLASNIGGSLLNVALWICIVFGIEFFQLGLKRDIKKEIYDENNIAAAIYELGIKLGVAWVIAKGLL